MSAGLPPFDCVVAADRRLGIGRRGRLPWHLPAELRHFRALTLGPEGAPRNAVIMGRLTWDSLPPRFRPLPGRANVVVSRGLRDPDATERALASSLDEALHLSAGAPERFVIGGAQLFQAAFQHPALRRVYLTEIDADFDCDVFLQPLSRFTRLEVSPATEEAGVRYRFVTLTPASTAAGHGPGETSGA